MNFIDEITQFRLHTRIEISLADWQIEFAVQVEPDLIVEGINDDDVHHDVVSIIDDITFIKIFPQTVKGLPVVFAESSSTVAVIEFITITTDKRKPVFFDDVVNPVEHRFFFQILKGLIEIYEPFLTVEANYFIVIDVYTDVATTTEEIKETVNVFWKQWEYLWE